MVSRSHWTLSGATLFQLVAEAFWVVLAVLLAFQLRGIPNVPRLTPLVPALVFAVLMMLMLGALGMYRRDRSIGLAVYVVRVFLAMLIVVPVAYLTADVMPGGRPFQETVSEWVLLAFAGLIVVRQLVTGPVLRLVLPHRVLVLGTGPEARLVEASLTSANAPGVHLVGFYSLEKVEENVVASNRIVPKRGSLDETVRELGIDEVIVAVREQRGGVLPLRGLLECRLSGVRITDLPRFFERVHGQIPIDALKASWLIYGTGFRQGWLRTLVKRIFDIVVSLTLLVAMLPIMLARGTDHRVRERLSNRLPAGTRRAARPDIRRAQVPQHAPGRGEGRQAGVGHGRRCAGDRIRPLHAPHPDRRAAAAHQRAAR